MQEFTSISFLNSSPTNNIFKKFSSSNILHNQVELLICFNYLIQLDNNRMSDLFQYMYLPSNSLNIMNIHNFILFQHLDGHLFPGQAMRTHNNLSKRAFTQVPPQLIMSYNLSFFVVLLLIMAIPFPCPSRCLYCLLFVNL